MSNSSIITVAGRNKRALKSSQNLPIVFTHIALGSGDRYPSGGETELENEIYRGNITSSGTLQNSPNTFWFELYVEADVETLQVQEMGLFDEDGILYALTRFPFPAVKFGPDAEASSDNTYRILIVEADVENIVVRTQSILGVQGNRRVDTGFGLKGGGDLSKNLLIEAHQATTEQEGVAQIATLEKAFLGQDNESIVTPALLASVLGKSADGLPLSVVLSNAGETLQNVPPLALTLCTNMVAVSGNAQPLWNGSRFIVDENSLGVYGIFNQLNIGGELGEGAATYKNGILHSSYGFSESTGNSNVVGFTSFVELLTPGDYVEFFHFHRSPASRQNIGSSAQIYRLFPFVQQEGA